MADAKEVVADAKESVEKKVSEAKDAVAQKVTEAKEAVNKATATEAKVEAPASYAACAGCHGKDGTLKALGKSAVIAGQSKEDIITKMNGYKAGTLNVTGMGSLMKGQVAKLSDADIEALATYISGLK
ncbi:MAG TPA: c-type cytochrome [Sulfurovum sp.]|nr:c-type cytochrome [Sulfurovum sp.]